MFGKILENRSQFFLLGALVLFGTGLWGCAGSVRRGPPVFIPGPPAKPRLQVLLSFANEKDLGGSGGAAAALLGKKKRKGMAFRKPYAALMHHGLLYVTDTGAHTVYVIDIKRKKFKRLAGVANMGQLKQPINLAFDAVDSLYVSDTRRRQVLVYDAQGRHTRTIGDGKSFRPSGVAIYGDRLIVSDMKNHRILVLNKSTGSQISEFGGPGVKPGQMSFPANIALDKEGNIYVSEPITGRVQKFSAAGELKKTFGRLGKRMGELVRPKGIDVDDAGRLWVVDAATEHAQIFDKKGRLLLFFGGNNNKPGSMYLPSGISVTKDPENLEVLAPYVDENFAAEALVIVVSQYGKRQITIYALGKRK